MPHEAAPEAFFDDDDDDIADLLRSAAQPALAHYHALCARMRVRVAGHDWIVRRLALAAVRHQTERVRPILLVGPPGSGKTTLATALAEAMGGPQVVIDVSTMTETNWSGIDLSQRLADLFRGPSGARDPRKIGHPCIVLDEIDKASDRGFVGTAREYRLGKQTSLLQLLSGGTIAITVNNTLIEWSSKSGFVICAGAFHGLVGPPTRSNLVSYGLMPELVDRIGAIIEVGPADPKALRKVLASEIHATARAYTRFGYQLCIADETLHHLTYLALDATRGLSARSAMALLGDAAERALIELLESEAPPGSVARIQPDDLAPGPRPKRSVEGL